MKNAALLILIKLLKGLVLFFTKILFRIEVRGLENIPKKGGALIISNHVSFLDNLIIGVHEIQPYIRHILIQVLPIDSL